MRFFDRRGKKDLGARAQPRHNTSWAKNSSLADYKRRPRLRRFGMFIFDQKRPKTKRFVVNDYTSSLRITNEYKKRKT